MYKLLLSLGLVVLLNVNIYAEIATKDSLTKLYVATFDRAPDSKGLNYWLNDSHLCLEDIATSFFDQDETKSIYPNGYSDYDFILAIYKNLFKRIPDSVGSDYWESELSSGRISKSVFILAVVNGAKGSDTDIVNNKTQVGLKFAEEGLEDKILAKEVMQNITSNKQTIVDSFNKISNVSINGNSNTVVSNSNNNIVGNTINNSVNIQNYYIDVSGEIQSKKPEVRNFKVSLFDSKSAKIKVSFGLSSDKSLTLARVHCGMGNNYDNIQYKDTSASIGFKVLYFNSDKWFGQRVYCKTEVKASNVIAKVLEGSVYIDKKPKLPVETETSSDINTLIQPVVSDFTVKEHIYNFWNFMHTSPEHDGYDVDVSFRVSSENKLTLVRTICGKGSNYKYPEYIDSSLKIGTKTVNLYNINWKGDNIFCKSEVKAGNSIANEQSDYVYIKGDSPTVSSISPKSTKSLDKKTKFTIIGTNLSSSLIVSINECSNMTSLEGSTTSMSFSCTPTSSGDKTGVIKEKVSGDIVFNFNIHIEKPELKEPDYSLLQNIFVDTKVMWQDDYDSKSVKKPFITYTNYYYGRYSTTTGDTGTTYCKNLSLGEYYDWRLPTIYELENLYNKKDKLKNVANCYYLSSNTYTYDNLYIWTFNFQTGFSEGYCKKCPILVRCVRDK